nr:ribonuclease H-like domain-containing protein [Tanacetum cinerariifolium]
MADFLHLDDAREIWLAVKARFGGNEESKKMRKTMLKQEFFEFCVFEEEGLHKGYDRFQKILSQLNQMQAKLDNDDVNLKFLRALLPFWSQVALTLKTRGGLVYLSFDDLYNKLRSLEIDVMGGLSYGSRGTVAPTHSAFIGATSTTTKMGYSDQLSHSSSITYTSAHSGSLMNETSNGRWLCYLYGSTSFKRRHEGRLTSRTKTLPVKTKEPKAMVSVDSMLNWNKHEAEHKPEEGEHVYGLMVGFKSDFADSAVNAAGSVYDAAAEFAMMGISPKVQTCPFDYDSKLSELKKNYARLETMYNDSFIQVQAYRNTVKTLELQKDWYHKSQLALEEKFRILSANLENTTNTLKYSETLYDHAKIEKKEWEVKLVESLARFDKWKASSKNLAKLINSSMTTRTKLGLGVKEYFSSDEVFNLSTPSIFDPEPVTREVKSLHERFVKVGDMHEVSPSITGTFMLTTSNFVLEDTQVTFGSKSPTSINTSKSNEFISCDNSDKSSESKTHDFASCVSSPMTTDSFSTVDVKILPKSGVTDPSPLNGVSSCSIKENVKPPSDLCNKRRIADQHLFMLVDPFLLLVLTSPEQTATDQMLLSYDPAVWLVAAGFVYAVGIKMQSLSLQVRIYQES